ncbi:MAG: hypothetical protein Q8N13_09220 [Acidovorax sp.]|nr:hypothetical protein [Acidovorax sp.]
MTPEQIQAMAKGIVDANAGPTWWVHLIMILLAGGAAYLGTYLAEKGKNLATKEDVEKITDKVEAVKRQHQEVLENLKAGHQLRMVAAERRLQAHQEAFTMWRELFSAMHTPEVTAAVRRCTQWWEKNCVYLGPKSHHAFFDAFWAAAIHSDLLANRSPASEITGNWKKIAAAPNIILEEVALPPLKVPVDDMAGVDEYGRKAQ